MTAGERGLLGRSWVRGVLWAERIAPVNFLVVVYWVEHIAPVRLGVCCGRSVSRLSFFRWLFIGWSVSRPFVWEYGVTGECCGGLIYLSFDH